MFRLIWFYPEEAPPSTLDEQITLHAGVSLSQELASLRAYNTLKPNTGLAIQLNENIKLTRPGQQHCKLKSIHEAVKEDCIQLCCQLISNRHTADSLQCDVF